MNLRRVGIIVLLFLVFAFVLGYLLSRYLPIKKTSGPVSHSIEFKSEFPGYELKETANVGDFAKYLDRIGFWGEGAIQDSKDLTQKTVNSLTVILTNKPKLGNQRGFAKDGVSYIMSSFASEIKGDGVIIYLHVDPDAIEISGLDLQRSVNNALMRATYLLTTNDATKYVEHVKEADKVIAEFYVGPMVSLIKKESLINNLKRLIVRDVYAQCVGCEQWQCGTAPFWQCSDDASVCDFDSDCAPYGTCEPVSFCTAAYCEDSSPTCDSPGGNCPAGQCVVAGSYSCACGPTPTTPPVCSCGSWTDQACGGGSCAADEREQTRTCSPGGCSSESRCVSDVSCAAPSCTLDAYVPSPVNVAAGDTANVTVNVTPVNGTIDRVDFSIDDSSRATIAPLSDTTVPYQTVITGVAPGSTILHASVFMGGVLRCGGVTPTANVNVGNAGAWWQVVDADVITNGDVVSPIPGTCSLPLCNPVFAIQGPGNSPGVPLYAGNYDFNSGVGQGTVSDSPPWGWHVNSNYSATTDYNYAFFYRLVPGDAVRNIIAVSLVDPNTLKNIADNAANVSPDGYTYIFRTGDLTVRGEPTLQGRKIILFVDGNLNIGDGVAPNGRINITKGTGFFMAIVSGDINVTPQIENPPGGEPELEGIFVANGNFITAADSEQLYIRGMVAAYNTVSLNRNLVDNTQIPAELFEYAPDLLFNYPSSLTLKRTRWKEITP